MDRKIIFIRLKHGQLHRLLLININFLYFSSFWLIKAKDLLPNFLYFNYYSHILVQFLIITSLLEEVFSRLLSEVLASVQDAVQQIKGLDLEGLRQQLNEMIASSTETTSPQAPDTARTQVGGYDARFHSELYFL